VKRPLLLLAVASNLWADGGVLVLRQQSGPLIVNVFMAAGDISVLLQDSKSLAPELDAEVSLTIDDDVISARHAAAQNKLLYAAPVKFDRPGRRDITITVRRAGETFTATGVIDVPPATTITHWGYLALPPAAIALFGLNQWLRRRMRTR
jgi:hypothetical protein